MELLIPIFALIKQIYTFLIIEQGNYIRKEHHPQH